MSFSSQILMFLGVSAVYIGFTFVWAWYKGKQDSEDVIAAAGTEPDEHSGDGRTAERGTENTMDTEPDGDGTTAENGGER